MAVSGFAPVNILEDDLGHGGAGGAWYHCSVKTVSRGSGRSAVAAAAYRLGASLHEELTDTTHDYRRRSGVVTTFILAPDDAPEWAFEPEAFWNAAEKAENRRNSRVARELELALPDALSSEERKEIALRAGQYLVDRYGVGVSIAIHEPGRHGDSRNHHAHLLFSTRRIGPQGFGAKTRELDDKAQGAREITALRQHMAFLINDVLARSGHDERVDHRSFKARGIAREGTKHLGPTASKIEQRGEPSRRGDSNRVIEAGNGQVDQLVSELAALDAELREVQEALLDERYGPPDMGEGVDLPAGASDAPIADGDKPEWYSELREPPPLLNEMQVDALMNQAAAPYLAQIHEHGTLRDGEPEGLRWHERIAAKGTELWRAARQWTRGKWQGFVANRHRTDEHQRGPDIER
jgi:hypothetical protein